MRDEDRPLYAALEDRLRRHGLGHKAEAIFGIAAPCIWLDTHKADDVLLPIGASKLGGVPDLPSGWAWPEWRGEPMAFIAQVRLDGAAPYDAEGALPHTGLLSFFFATDCEPKGNSDDDDPTSWRVLHLDGDPATFVRQEVPARLGERSRFPSSSMTCSRRLTLPTVDGPEYLTLGLSDAERQAYIDFEFGPDMIEGRPTYPEKGTYLLGHPFELENGALLHGYLASRGLEEPCAENWQERSREQRGEPMRTDMALGLAAHAEWRLLFQTDGGASDIDWAGGGSLHVTIAREALRRRNFSQVWMDIDFL